MFVKLHIKPTELLIALIAIFPSFAFIPQYFYLLLFPLVFDFKTKIDYNWLIIALIIFLSIVNQFIHLNILFQEFSIGNLVPYSIFMFISYYFAFKVNRRILSVVLIFILIEIFVGILEYSMHVKSFFPSVLANIQGEAPFGMRGLIYYKRVAGLSSNSSVFAFKVLAGFFILQILNIKGRKRSFVFIMLLIGLFITFTRSAILALGFFILLTNIPIIKQALIRLFYNKSTKIYFLYALILLVLILISIYNWDVIYNQLNRGMKNADLSSRDTVFATFFDFLKDNLFLGNGSYKLWIDINGSKFHAHNSIMETFVTNGIIIGFFYLCLIFRNINKKNYPYILTFLVASLFQYIIFWGISFMDLIFFTFLLIQQNSRIPYETT